jgi:hypothetical protein
MQVFRDLSATRDRIVGPPYRHHVERSGHYGLVDLLLAGIGGDPIIHRNAIPRLWRHRPCRRPCGQAKGRHLRVGKEMIARTSIGLLVSIERNGTERWDCCVAKSVTFIHEAERVETMQTALYGLANKDTITH